MKPKYVTILFLLLIAAAVVFWKIHIDLQHRQEVVMQPKAPAVSAAPQSLGAQVYQQTQAPAAGQIPNNNPFSQSANPIQQSYTNPF
ncbi:MAG: hypothetical protein KGJ93_04170 [Patescibacteria group bacterium]|nr:hypothetical protein [Patescibacteria group bacterium]